MADETQNMSAEDLAAFDDWKTKQNVKAPHYLSGGGESGSFGSSYARAVSAGVKTDIYKDQSKWEGWANIMGDVTQTGASVVSYLAGKNKRRFDLEEAKKKAKQSGNQEEVNNINNQINTSDQEINQGNELRDNTYNNLIDQVINQDGSLTANHYDSEREVFMAIYGDTWEEQITQAEAQRVVKALHQINQREIDLRMMIAEVPLDEWSNHDGDYTKNMMIQFLDDATKRVLIRVKDPNGNLTDKYEWAFVDDTDRQITTSEIYDMYLQNRKDMESIIDMRSKFATFSKNVGSGEADLNQAENYINNFVDNGNVSKLAYDDIFEGRSFYNDLDNHPFFEEIRKSKEIATLSPKEYKKQKKEAVKEFRKNNPNLDVDLFKREYDAKMQFRAEHQFLGTGPFGLDVKKLNLPAEEGERNWWENISEDDIAMLKDAIVNNKNPYHNPAITKDLLKEYYLGIFEDESRRNTKITQPITYNLPPGYTRDARGNLIGPRGTILDPSSDEYMRGLGPYVPVPTAGEEGGAINPYNIEIPSLDNLGE